MKSVYKHLTERSAPVNKVEPYLLQELRGKSKLPFNQIGDSFVYTFKDTQNLEEFYIYDGLIFDKFESNLWGHAYADVSFTLDNHELFKLITKDTISMIEKVYNIKFSEETFNEMKDTYESFDAIIDECAEEVVANAEINYTKKLFSEFCKGSKFFSLKYITNEVTLELSQEDVVDYLDTSWKEIGCVIKLQPIWGKLKMEVYRLQEDFNIEVQDRLKA